MQLSKSAGKIKSVTDDMEHLETSKDKDAKTGHKTADKCKCCPYQDGCYKEGAKKKTYTETFICDSHSEQAEFQETGYSCFRKP